MNYITFGVIYIYILVWIYDIFKKKNYFGLGNIIFFAIVINIILFMFKWSSYIQEKLYDNTYCIISLVLIVFILIMLLSKNHIKVLNKENEQLKLKNINFKFYRLKLDVYTVINIFYIFLFLLENYMGSKTLFPNLNGIDIHGYSAPIISFITRALFVISMLNFLAYNTFKKKKYIIFIIVDILLFFITRGARINVFIAAFQFGIFYFMYNCFSIIKNKKRMFKIGLIIITIIFIGAIVGDMRVSNNMSSTDVINKQTYSELIQYTGPKDKFNILPWYYGYFPMSYGNLDSTIKSIDNSNVRTYGIYTFRPILVGIFQLDNLIPGYVDMDFSNSFAKIYNGSSAVTTGFVEFYLDFGLLMFIPILIYASIALYFYNKTLRDKVYIIHYSLLAGFWFFMSFQNFMIDVVTWYSLLYICLINKFFIYKDNN